jgi:hypothetical protein
MIPLRSNEIAITNFKIAKGKIGGKLSYPPAAEGKSLRAKTDVLESA